MAIQSQTSATFFTSYLVASTNFVYNSSASTNADAGWVTSRSDYIAVQVCAATVDTVTAIPLTYRIEGRSDTINRTASIYCATAVANWSIDKVINVAERFKEFRVGVKINGVPGSPLASPTYFHAGINFAEVN